MGWLEKLAPRSREALDRGLLHDSGDEGRGKVKKKI
jgi:hypothetical protein